MYLPNFLNIIIVFASIPVQDNRYLYANLLVCYLLIIVLISVIQRSKDTNELLSKKHEEAIANLQENARQDIEDEHIDDEHANNEEEITDSQRELTQEELEAQIRAEILKELGMDE